MHYSTVFFKTATWSDVHIVNYVAGCFDADDATCANRNPSLPQVHFTLETWSPGNIRAQGLPQDARPVLLGVLDYDLVQEWYLWGDIIESAQNSDQHLFLNYYPSYNASNFKPHLFFDSWVRIFEILPPNLIARCSEMVPTTDNAGASGLFRHTDQYSKLTNDTGISCHHNDTVWFSPSCRASNSECVPLLIQYDFDYAMQIAFFLNMPLAVVLVRADPDGSFSSYYRAVREGRFLFFWYQPDDSLLDAGGRLPAVLNMPRANELEQQAGLFRTGMPAFKPRNYGWRSLEAVDRLVAALASRVTLYNREMDGLMAASHALKAGGSLDPAAVPWAVACDWVRRSAARWSAWIPAACGPGSLADSTLLACLPCPPGSYCLGGAGTAQPCPQAAYCPAAASAPVPCPAGWSTDDLACGSASATCRC